VPERGSDLDVAEQEGSLVEAFASEPAGDFVVALAGVARTTDWHHVVERVPPAALDGEHAVTLAAYDSTSCGHRATRVGWRDTPARTSLRPVRAATNFLRQESLHEAWPSRGDRNQANVDGDAKHELPAPEEGEQNP
jgi:hypothetical protein